MRALVQRVSSANVRVEGRVVGEIGAGLLVLTGITHQDGEEAATWLAKKLAALRIFSDPAGLMNLSLKDIGGEALAVSQFTLYASTRKGNRPSYTDAAAPEVARPLFDRFASALAQEIGKPVPTGVFGAHMQVALVNDGPVTLWLDSERRD